MNSPQFIIFDNFKAYPRLVCVFSTRKGGISVKDYQSLNLGLKTGDRNEFIIENRRRFFNEINVNSSQIAYSDQVHSGHVECVADSGIYRQTDALITDKLNLFLTIQTADCFPVFLYGKKKSIVAAIHAGWRGVFNNIIENTVGMAIEKFRVDPADIIAAIGPGLQRECFEIRRDVFNLIDDKYLSDHPEKEKKYFDLRQTIYDRLLMQGIGAENIDKSEICTKCDRENFFS